MISTDGLIRRCVAGEEAKSIMLHCHNSVYGANGERIAAKISYMVGYGVPLSLRISKSL